MTREDIPSRDLGRIDAPVLIFGGPYGNLEATAALLAAARRLDIPPARIICTGDLAAYCADPAATIAMIRAADINCVMGNVEQQLAQGGGDCGCGFTPGSTCERLSDAWYAHADRHTDSEMRRWMAALPRRIDLRLGGRRLAVVHGAPSLINRFIYASTPAQQKLAEIALAGTDGVIGGHSGLPFSQMIDGRLWHNAGVIGLPANDGTPRIWFSVIAPEPGRDRGPINIVHHALDYDHRQAAARMRADGLPPAYALALETGLWPSVDILPPAERRAQGRPIRPFALTWPEALVEAGD